MPTLDQIYHKRPELEKGIYYAQTCKAGNMLYVSGCSQQPRSVSRSRPDGIEARRASERRPWRREAAHGYKEREHH